MLFWCLIQHFFSPGALGLLVRCPIALVCQSALLPLIVAACWRGSVVQNAALVCNSGVFRWLGAAFCGGLVLKNVVLVCNSRFLLWLVGASCA